MKVLITGHKGFCGKHFHKKLAGDDVLGIDIKDGNDCREFFRNDKRRFDLVIHLAAIVGGRETIENNPLATAVNFSIDAEMFDWAVRTRQKRLVYFSSSAVYPVSLQNKPYKLKESDINWKNVGLPDQLYGWTKLVGELLGQTVQNSGIKVHIFRPFSGYGEDQDLAYPFPSFIKRIKDKTNPFIIWGDGNQTRDFIHIDDIVEAVMEAIKLDITGPINIGTGKGTSFNELAKKMFEIADLSQPKIRHNLNKPSGVKYRCADNTKMLGFYKSKISLEEGIKRAIMWE